MMTIKFPFQPHEEWERRIKMGRVLVNKRAVKPEFVLSISDEISHYNPRVVEPSVPDEVEVLEELEDYVIVYKPAPMPMHPGGRYFKNTLTEILKDQGFKDLRITHRLDAVTSGIVLLAKNRSFAQKTMHCFAEGKVSKMYFALADGIPRKKTMTINAPIRRKKGFVFECGEHLEKAKSAITHFEVIEEREHSAIIKCIPETGRTHQIRLHLAKWGYPIVDDLIYGKEGDQTSKTTQKRAISLVSAGLTIDDLSIDYLLSYK